MNIINSSIDMKVVLKEVSCDVVEIDIFVRLDEILYYAYHSSYKCYTY